MPYYPQSREKAAYEVITKGEKLVMDYLHLNIFEIQDMPIDLYLFFMREAYIYQLNQTKEGREYLSECWRMEQTRPDRNKIKEKIQEQKMKGAINHGSREY